MSKILVIEDDEVTREVLVKAVEGMGHTAVQASDGRRGLGVLQDNKDVKLVITDLMMPELCGQELVQIVRGNNSWQEVPIIMVSGVVALSDIVKILELGATRFLPKPICVKDLRAYISTLLGDKNIA